VDFKPVVIRRASEDAAVQIAEAVRMGDLRPGERLPSERELAGQMRISRPTVREALRVLAEAGVVEIGAAGAIVITEVVPRTLLDERDVLRESEISGVLEARRLLEPRVAQLAAVNADERDLDAMAATIDRLRGTALTELDSEYDDFFLHNDLQFHLLMARATRNGTIVRLMHGLIKDLELARTIAMRQPSTSEWVVDIHERTLAAIRSRNLDLLERVMDEHLSTLEQTWERESGRSLLRPVPGFLQSIAAKP
jgi:GntR family transcriptional repressor for pyruvate dehydrogenase complex